MRKKTYLNLIEYQTEQSRQHLAEVQGIYQEMRGYKHDFHHHLQTLKGQLEAGETKRALAYLEQLDQQLMTVDTLLKTGNVALDAILSAKISQAKALGIAVTVKANVPGTLLLSDLELSIIVGNLLENAIEACQCAKGERFLRLFLGMKGKMLYFSMLNSAGAKASKKESSSPPAKQASTASACAGPKASWRPTAAGASTTARTGPSPPSSWCPPWNDFLQG